MHVDPPSEPSFTEEEAARRRDEVSKRMLNTPPKPHAPDRQSRVQKQAKASADSPAKTPVTDHELTSDEIDARREAGLKKLLKTPPKPHKKPIRPRVAEEDSALMQAYSELRHYLASDEVPPRVKAALPGLTQGQKKLFITVGVPESALGADDKAIRFEPSNLLLELVAAAKTLDWPKVAILIHEASLPL
jgi:hypothetical protein